MTNIPESVKVRLQKLLALANDDRGNEHVAATASAKVQALLAEYNLELSQIDGTDDENPDAGRERADDAVLTQADWQRQLLFSIGENNFCYVFRDYGTDLPSYSMVGRKINITATLQMYAYLTGAIARLNPFTDKRTRAHRSWQDGCSVRLRDRLYTQRRESEAASRAAQTAHASANPDRGSGTDIVLSDVYSTEDDLNRDFRFGYPPGQTARERAERNARWEAEKAARAAEPPPPPEPVKPETEAQRNRRAAKEKAEYERSWKRWQRQQARDAAKIDAAAYNMGHNAGGQISLDQQIGAPVKRPALA